MLKEDLVWLERGENCYLLFAIINGEYIGLGFVVELDENEWYYKGDDRLGSCISGIVDHPMDAMDIVENNVDLTAY